MPSSGRILEVHTYYSLNSISLCCSAIHIHSFYWFPLGYFLRLPLLHLFRRHFLSLCFAETGVTCTINAIFMDSFVFFFYYKYLYCIYVHFLPFSYLFMQYKHSTFCGYLFIYSFYTSAKSKSKLLNVRVPRLVFSLI